MNLKKDTKKQKMTKVPSFSKECLHNLHFIKNKILFTKPFQARPCWYHLVFVNTVSKMNGFYLTKDYDFLDKDYETALVWIRKFSYLMRAIITHSWFEAVLDYKPRILDPKIEGFPCLVHKLSVTLTALRYKLWWKRG